MIRQSVLTLCCLAFFTAAHADVMCRDYKYVSIGDTQEDVVATCGAPDSKTSSQEPISNPMDMEQYVFQISNSNIVPAGTMAPRVTVTVVSGKVVRIATDSGKVQSLDFCRGEVISVGDDEMKLTSFCPKPLSHTTGAVMGEPVKMKVDVWVYKLPTGDVTMRFVEGVLQKAE